MRREKPALIVLFAIVCAMGLIGSMFGTYDFFHHLTGDVARSVLVTLNIEGAIMLFLVWALSADDWITFTVTLGVGILYGVFALIVQVADGMLYDPVQQKIIGTDQLALVVSRMVWVFPTMTALLGFLIHIMDSRLGKNKEPFMDLAHLGLGLGRGAVPPSLSGESPFPSFRGMGHPGGSRVVVRTPRDGNGEDEEEAEPRSGLFGRG